MVVAGHDCEREESRKTLIFWGDLTDFEAKAAGENEANDDERKSDDGGRDKRYRRDESASGKRARSKPRPFQILAISELEI